MAVSACVSIYLSFSVCVYVVCLLVGQSLCLPVAVSTVSVCAGSVVEGLRVLVLTQPDCLFAGGGVRAVPGTAGGAESRGVGRLHVLMLLEVLGRVLELLNEPPPPPTH